jgi:PAS domain S-box-containing protein
MFYSRSGCFTPREWGRGNDSRDGIVERKVGEAVALSPADAGTEERSEVVMTRFWQAALAESPHLVCALDTEKRILAVSDALARRLGRRPADLVGTICSDVMHVGEDAASCPFAGLLLDGACHGAEVACQKLGGDFFVMVIPFPGPDGTVGGVLHALEDISERNRREADLLRREQHFSMLFHEAPLGYQSLDEEGRLMEVNKMWLATLGYDRSEVIGRWFGEFLAPEFVDGFRQRFPLFKERGSIHSEFEMLRKDGARRLIAFEGRIGHRADGSFKQTHCILSDVTEPRRAELALQESEQRYRDMVENSPIGMFQSTLAGKVAFCNPALARIFGYDTAEDMLETVNETSAGEKLWVDSSERARIIAQIQSTTGWRTFDVRLRQSDEAVMECQLVLGCRNDLNGESHLYGFVQDFTAERKAYRELEKDATLLEEAEELAKLGCWEWDLSTNLTRYSAGWQRIYGVQRDEFSLDESLRLIHPHDRGIVNEAIATVRESGSLYHARYRIVRRDDGQVRHVEGFGRPVRDREGAITHVYGASLDVTEEVEAREELAARERRLQQALDGMVAALGATIEIRDPYTAGHERRVAELAVRIAEGLGWDDRDVLALRTAAQVHDIGKIGIPAEILTKPSRLSEMEFAIVRGHPRAAYDILATIDFDLPIAGIVLQHHERLDGSGYPEGLAGEEILPAARVLAVADTVEAMISHRPYRAALPLIAAREELLGGSGVRYDPVVVAACLPLMDDNLAFLAPSVLNKP